VGSSCDIDNPQSFAVVSSSPVTLVCCVEEFPCPEWSINWYKNGNIEEIAQNQTVNVSLTEAQETFTCVVKAENVIPDPVCEAQYQGSITLIQG